MYVFVYKFLFSNFATFRKYLKKNFAKKFIEKTQSLIKYSILFMLKKMINCAYVLIIEN